ncbi:hypothetical protein Tco_0184373 [Tanacetum coccineum]
MLHTLIHLPRMLKMVNQKLLMMLKSSPDVNTGSIKLNVVGPSVNTASSNKQDIPEDMFTMGVSHTLEATRIKFFSDDDEPEVDLGNITNSYTVPTTPNIRIHKDHPIDNVIGDVKSYVQTRRMTKPTSEQGFLSDVYEQKTHDTLNTCLNACFLSQIEPTSIAKSSIDSSWWKHSKERTSCNSNFNISGILMICLVGKRQEEGIDYEELFAPVARIKTIRLFLAYASFMDPYPSRDKVYKVVKAPYGVASSHQEHGRITPLFDTMIVQASEEVDEDSDHPTDSNQIPIVDQPSTSSQPSKNINTVGEAVTTAGVKGNVAPIIPTTIKETLAQTLMEIKVAKPKAKRIAFHDQEEQPERPLKRKEQVALDEQMAKDIQAQLDAKIIGEERLERKKQEEANIALIESWENTQAMMEADRLLAERLQTREREELTDKEKGKLFMELIEKRIKYFTALRARKEKHASYQGTKENSNVYLS